MPTMIFAVLFVLSLAALPALARRVWLRLRAQSIIDAGWTTPEGSIRAARIAQPIPAERIRRRGGRAFIACFRVA